MFIGAFLETIGVGLMAPLVSAVTDEHIMGNNRFSTQKRVLNVYDILFLDL